MFRIVVTVPAQIEGPALTSGAFVVRTVWVVATSICPVITSPFAAATRRVRIEEPNLRLGTERFTSTPAMTCSPERNPLGGKKQMLYPEGQYGTTGS